MKFFIAVLLLHCALGCRIDNPIYIVSRTPIQQEKLINAKIEVKPIESIVMQDLKNAFTKSYGSESNFISIFQ